MIYCEIKKNRETDQVSIHDMYVDQQDLPPLAVSFFKEREFLINDNAPIMRTPCMFSGFFLNRAKYFKLYINERCPINSR